MSLRSRRRVFSSRRPSASPRRAAAAGPTFPDADPPSPALRAVSAGRPSPAPRKATPSPGRIRSGPTRCHRRRLQPAGGNPEAGRDHEPTSLVKDPKQGRAHDVARPGPDANAATLRPPPPTPLETPRRARPLPRRPRAEADWRGAHAPRAGRVEELRAEIAQLEADAKQLETDFYRWDDGQYRDRVIKPAWDKKREELETRRRQLVDAEAELADLPEQARKAGALPGWLRE